MAVVTITDYAAPARRPFSRQCPNFRLPWAGMSTSYDVSVGSHSEKMRRLAFLLVQGVQLANLVLLTGVPTSPFDIPWVLAQILFFFFVAWNLHLIVSMEGERVVFGKVFGRKWFDGFLWGCVAGYTCVLGMKVVAGWQVGSATLWVMLDLAIFGVAWVSTWREGAMILG